MTPIKQAESIQPDDGEQVKKVGDILREARVARDKELPEVAKQLRIRLEFLQAIEDNRPKDLPGNAYALGFVRTYSGFLNLDSKQLVDQFKAEVEAIENLTELNFPEPLPAKSVPGGALVFIGLLLFGLFYGLWYYLNSQGKSFTELVPELPESLQQLISGEDGDDSSQAPQALPDNGNSVSTAPVTPSAPEAAPATTSGVEAPPATEPMTPEAPATPAPETVTEAVTDTAQQMGQETTSVEVDNQTAEAIEQAPEAADVVVEEITPSASDTMTETAESEITQPVEETQSAASETEAAIEQTAEAAVTASEEATTSVADPQPAAAESSQPETTEASETTAEEQVASAPSDSTPETPAALRPAAPNPVSSNLPTARPEPKVYGEENTAARVVITAKATAWVEISSGDGNLLLTRLLNAGDSYRVPNQAGITLITGNAGALEIHVDGEKAPAIGEIGAVVRDVSLDPDSLTTNQ